MKIYQSFNDVSPHYIVLMLVTPSLPASSVSKSSPVEACEECFIFYSLALFFKQTLFLGKILIATVEFLLYFSREEEINNCTGIDFLLLSYYVIFSSTNNCREDDCS